MDKEKLKEYMDNLVDYVNKGLELNYFGNKKLISPFKASVLAYCDISLFAEAVGEQVQKVEIDGEFFSMKHFFVYRNVEFYTFED